VMSVSPRVARNVDHLVLPVKSLSLARERLSLLGFTVAPDAVHPFGTENACVFFEDGTYLEPLAIAQRETCEAQAQKGNVFVARDQAYRFRRGNDGFSALVMGTDDAKADHKHFRKLGISGGKRLKFSRKFENPKGKKSEGRFKLAFAADLRSPDSFVFTCERENAPKIGGALQQHENGCVGMREIVAGEVNPSDFQYFLQEVVNQREINAHSFGIELMSGNANIAVYDSHGLRAWYGIETGCHARGLRFRAVSVACKDLSALEKLLKRKKVANRKISNRIVVDPAPGQGYTIAFEQA
jgi:hypothetical protein